MKNNAEIWLPVNGYEGYYEVSNLGNVRNTKTKKCKSVCKNGKGYLQVNISVYGKECVRRVHRLTAEAWIPNPDKKPQVNHKNGIKTDNRIENLEWCTQEENIQHRVEVLSIYAFPVPKCPVIVYDKSGNAKEYESMSDAAIAIYGTKTKTQNISRAAKSGGIWNGYKVTKK